MTKHTKGPWSFAHNGAGDSKTSCIDIAPRNSKGFRGQVAYLQSAEHIDGITMAENEANARLIAAAPDLLEALDELANGYAGNRFDVGIVHRIKKARDVIAKARGDQ